MAAVTRAPRIWIDVEYGANFGDAAGCLAVFSYFRGVTAPVREIWLFQQDTDPLIRGFYYPRNLHERFGVPNGRGPSMVLIDQRGDHQWFSGASCRPGDACATAGRILVGLGITDATSGPGAPASLLDPQSSIDPQTALDPPTAFCPLSSFGPLSSFDEVHIVDGELVSSRLVGERVPSSPPGRTFTRGGRVVTRMEFDKGGITATDLRELWAMATQPHGWLGAPTALALYDDRRRSEESGYDGCQLIATGRSGRDLWMQLPDPDEYHRVAPGRQRQQYEGAFSEYEAAKQWIFRSVGADIGPHDDRPLRDRLLGRHRVPPAVVRWP